MYAAVGADASEMVHSRPSQALASGPLLTAPPGPGPRRMHARAERCGRHDRRVSVSLEGRVGVGSQRLRQLPHQKCRRIAYRGRG
eukprot:scaffold207_cov409-Prasinococcus_capsulatus_cf.AAC.20